MSGSNKEFWKRVVFGEDSTEEVGPELSLRMLAVRRNLERASQGHRKSGTSEGQRQECANVPLGQDLYPCG